MSHVTKQTRDQVEAKIRWTRYIGPTHSSGNAYGVCDFDKYIAVVGEVKGDPHYAGKGRPYVVLLRKSDRGVVRDWIGGEEGIFFNCISIDGNLYAVGGTKVGGVIYRVIYVFDVNLNILARITGESPSAYLSLAYDGNALYLGGWAYEDVNGDNRLELVGLVEKRALDTNISPVNSKKIYSGSWKMGLIDDMRVDPSTGKVLAGGFYKDSKDKIHLLMIIFDGDLRELERIDYPEVIEWTEPYGIAFDDRYVYILRGLGFAKFTVDGELEP